MQLGCRHAVLSRNCLLRSNAPTIANTSMRAGPILTFTPLGTLSLLDALSDCLPLKGRLTSCSLHLLDPGASALSLKMHLTSWSTAITPVARKKGTLWTCHHTRPSWYHFSQLMGRTRALDNSTNQSPYTPLRRPGLRDSHQFNLTRLPCSLQSPTDALLFDGPACRS